MEPALTLLVHGPAAQEVARDLAELLRSQLPDWPCSLPPAPQTHPSEATRGGEGLAMVAIALALPPAVLATWDLAVRARVAERLRGLIHRVRRHLEGCPGSDVRCRPAGGASLALDESELDRIVDALAEMARRNRESGGTP